MESNHTTNDVGDADFGFRVEYEVWQARGRKEYRDLDCFVEVLRPSLQCSCVWAREANDVNRDGRLGPNQIDLDNQGFSADHDCECHDLSSQQKECWLEKHSFASC